MNLKCVRILGAVLVFCATSSAGTTLDAQNQTPARPQTGGRGNQPAPGNQTAAAPANQTPAKPAEPAPIAGAPIYISPGIVQMIQQRLLAMGLPVPTTSGAWGDHSAAALAQFQKKQGLDPGGDLDELTLAALGLSQVLAGEVPPGGDAPVSASAAASGGAPLAASPRLTRVVQNKLTEAGFPTHNLFGIWIRDIDNAPRNFQKAKSLDITNSFDLQILHALGLIDSLIDPKPGKLPTDSVAQILSNSAVLMTGAPLSLSAFGIRQVQSALQQRGFKEITPDGKWSDNVSAAVKKFQESQKFEPTGSLNLRTLRALGFTNPLPQLDVPTPPGTARPTK
jgi:peptidoglycan hydrolase-like protein with peptidoglycan-binding domain